MVRTKGPLVSVVDDDESVRESLPDLLREFSFVARAFSSAEEFLASDCVGGTGCLILDIAMPGMSGPDLQQEWWKALFAACCSSVWVNVEFFLSCQIGRSAEPRRSPKRGHS